MTRRFAVASLALAAALAVSGLAAHAASDNFLRRQDHPHYGRGYSPGGGFDAYSRTPRAAHAQAHIPGNPTVIVQNRPGAGGRIAANYLYHKVKPDGLTIGHCGSAASMLQQYLGDKGVRFDAAKFEMDRRAGADTPTCAWPTSGAASSTWPRGARPRRRSSSAASRPGSTMSDIPMILIEPHGPSHQTHRGVRRYGAGAAGGGEG